MTLVTETPKSARSSLKLIVIGSLLIVWSIVWYLYLRTTDADKLFYVCYGFFGTGLVLTIIGLAVGQIGRSAREAELPPVEPVVETVKEPVREPAAVAVEMRRVENVRPTADLPPDRPHLA